MAIEIRAPAEDELRAAMEAATAAFGDGLFVEDHDWERESKTLSVTRSLAAFDGGRPVGLAGAYEFDLGIPGGQLSCAGVTWVGVLPSHRRRGILRDFMQRQLADIREWGEPIAALWASEAAIYGRFGYGLAAPGMAMKSDRARFALRDDDGPQGTVRLVEAEQAYELFPPVYERVRAARAGMLTRTEHWWREHRLADHESWRRGASRKYYVAIELDGQVEAYAMYRVKSEWEDGLPRGEVRVIEAFATSASAERELWRFLHGIDLTVRVDVFYLDPASPLPLVVRDPRALGLRLGDGLWLRFVDLDAALEARSYRSGDSVVLEVRDELCPWNAGRYRAGDGAGRTDDQADLELDVADLASAYLGAFDFHRLVHAGRLTELRDGAAEAASLLFRTDLPPFCPEEF
ncbi:MAG: GNAT family N-acetyltransferase [Actinobacteria bacterium]|nr:GNAT family N-acetyltransferase [Actinomycetota bacterium]